MKALFFSISLLAITHLFAQTTKRKKIFPAINGIWELVTVKSVSADSSVSYPYGEHPFGNMLLMQDGNYSVQIYSASRTKIISGNKSTATPEENIMMVKGSNAHYGKYELDIKSQVIIFKPEHAFFPNWEGQELKQSFVLEGNMLTYSSSASTFGANKSVVIWKMK